MHIRFGGDAEAEGPKNASRENKRHEKRGAWKSEGYSPRKKKIKYEDNEDESKIEINGDVKVKNTSKRFSHASSKAKSSDSHTLEEKINSTLDHISSSRFRSWRLMMRNLPFQTKEQDLHDICKNIGPVTEIVLPKCKDSRFPDSCAGFAFIQFKKRPDAIKALETLNMSEVKGRKIAVDWALPKDTYETAKHEEKQKQQQTQETSNKGNYEDNVDVCDDDDRGTCDVYAARSDSDGNNDDDDDDDNEDSDDESENSGDDSDSEESGTGHGGDNKGGTNKKQEIEGKREFEEDKAVLQGHVVFIRNLSYNVTEEELKEALSRFGNIRLAKICRYTGSEHSKGTAFVHFGSAEEADECLLGIRKYPFITLDGRHIFGDRALPRCAIAKLEKEKHETQRQDRRNLFLLRASYVRPDDGPDKMSVQDERKREGFRAIAMQKMKNPHMFVSTTRLVVRNLPKTLTDKAFRTMCYRAAGNPDAVITEYRIWRDRSKVDESGVAKSRGFGFVNFTKFKDAYAALKHLNNNPEIFGPKQRPIVEFAIENRAALRIREARQKKLKSKQATTTSEETDPDLLEVEKLENRALRTHETQPKKSKNKQKLTVPEELDLDLLEVKKQLRSQRPLPSHAGPKIRWKKGKKTKPNAKKAKKAGTSKGVKKRSENKSEASGKMPKKKKKRNLSTNLAKYLTLCG